MWIVQRFAFMFAVLMLLAPKITPGQTEKLEHNYVLTNARVLDVVSGKLVDGQKQLIIARAKSPRSFSQMPNPVTTQQRLMCKAMWSCLA